jgi:hypothetical protein
MVAVETFDSVAMASGVRDMRGLFGERNGSEKLG